MEEGHQLKLPDSVRLQIGRVSHLYLAPGPDGCLLICTPAALRQFVARRVEAEETDGLARAARRMFFARIERCAVDAGGSFRVPEEHARHAGLEREVVVVGVDDRLELWDVQRWKEYLERVSAPAPTAPPTSGTSSVGTPPAVSPPATGPQEPR
jgi:MraZ protein